MYFIYSSNKVLADCGMQLLRLFNILVLMCISHEIYAQTNPSINLANNELVYEKEQEKQKIIEKKYIQQSKTTEKTTINQDYSQKNNLNIECLPYEKVEIIGATVVDVEPFKIKADECINKERINKLNRDIIRAYLQEGYARVTTSFKVKTDKNQNTKKLLLTIHEGIIKSITSDSGRLNVNSLFPNMVGKPLKIKDLDQGLDQTNYLSNTDASLDIYSNDDGTIDVALSNQSRKSNLSGNVSIDNNGSTSTGKWVGRVLVSADSPLNLSDKLTATASQSLAGLKKNKATTGKKNLTDENKLSRSVGVNYSVPYGALRVGAYGSVSDYQSPVELPNSGIHEQSGNSSQAGVNADLVISRGQNHVSKLTGNVEKYKSESYFDDSLIEVQSPELNSAKIGVNHMLIQPTGVILVDGFYETNFETKKQKERFAKKNKPLLPKYNLYGLNADAYFYHDELKWIKARWRNQHNLKIRYAKDGLPAIKQDNLLSANSVRGFDELSSNGEKSLAFQSTYFLTKRHKNWLIEPYVGMDFAIQASEDNKKTAIGGAVGIKATHKKQTDNQNYQLNLEYAKGLLKEKQETTEANDVTMKLKWLF